MFCYPEHTQPAVQLPRLLTLVKIVDNIYEKISTNSMGEFSTEKTLRIFPMRKEVQ